MEGDQTGLVDAALTILVEARRRSEENQGTRRPFLDADARRRLDVAIAAAHTVVEPPTLPTDGLRAMGLWWEP